MVKINGENKSFEGKTIEEALILLEFDRTRIAVELNGEIVAKSKYGSTVLKDGDCLEAVNFVGGG